LLLLSFFYLSEFRPKVVFKSALGVGGYSPLQREKGRR
jgi:hypothetical protein